MAAEVTLKEESALEIGEQLAFSFKGLQNVGADTANGLELEEEKQTFTPPEVIETQNTMPMDFVARNDAKFSQLEKFVKNS